MPEKLPLGHAKFDLIYAFSIFTHLPQKSARACMDAIYNSIKPDGLAIITIRPLEFWDYAKSLPEFERLRLSTLHRSQRIAFYPDKGQYTAADGSEVVYGDESIPPDIIESLFLGWRVVKAGSTIIDPLQIFVVLSP